METEGLGSTPSLKPSKFCGTDMEQQSLTKAELEKLYYSMTNKALCEKLGITNPTLTSYVKKAGIPLKGSGNRTVRSKILIT